MNFLSSDEKQLVEFCFPHFHRMFLTSVTCFSLTAKLEENGLAENPGSQKFSVFFTKLRTHELQTCEGNFSHGDRGSPPSGSTRSLILI